jgi:hypothetical protein
MDMKQILHTLKHPGDCGPCSERREKLAAALRSARRSRVVVAGTKAAKNVQETVQKWTPARRYGGGD